MYFPSPSPAPFHRVRVQDIVEHSVPLKSHVCLLSLVFSLRMKVMHSQKVCFLSHYYSLPPSSVPNIIVPATSAFAFFFFLHAIVTKAGKHSFAG